MINLGALNAVVLMKGDGAKPAKGKFDRENPYNDPPAAQTKPDRAEGAGKTIKMLDYNGKPVTVKVGGRGKERPLEPNPYLDKAPAGAEKRAPARHYDNFDGTPSDVTAGSKKKRHFDPNPY